MKLKYLGTAAAEAFPAIFCRCGVCERARKNGGRDIRGRSGMIVNGKHLIDFPPDLYFNALRLGVDLTAVEDLFVTHSHIDHFAHDELVTRETSCYCHGVSEQFPVYGNAEVGRQLRIGIERDFGNTPVKAFPFTEIEYFKGIPAGEVTFTPLPSLHMPSEQSAFYLVEGEGKRFIYAHDTGVFPEETFEFLKGKRLDGISLDCCFGLIRVGGGHMGLPNNLDVLKRLRELGTVDDGTKVIISHFSHNCGSLYDELQEEAFKYGIRVAYDGMEFEL